jgi:hypothetical protein
MGVSFTDDIEPLFVETVAAKEEEASEFEDDVASLAGIRELSVQVRWTSFRSSMVLCFWTERMLLNL